MLKKVHISEPEIKLPPHKDAFRCFLCDRVSNRVAYVCEAGHVVCKSCRRNDNRLPRLENNHTTKKREPNLKAIAIANVEPNASCRKDFASGDHHCCKYHTAAKSISTSNIKTGGILSCKRKSYSDEGIPFKSKETIVRFQNDNFYDSESSVPCSLINEKEVKKITEIIESPCQRPVTCPVAECNRILAPESVLKHFFFDHSKLPKVQLNDTGTQLSVQISAINEKMQCYAIFFLKNDTSLSHAESGLMNGDKNASFLLMGVRMPSSAETIRKPHGSDIVSIQHVQTQTDVCAKSLKVKSLMVHEKPAISKKLGKRGLKRSFTRDEALVLWICKLGDDTYYYNMSVTRPDKRLGFSVIGETIGVKDCQHAEMLNDNLGCLFLQGKAGEKLVNNQNQLEICINVFK